MKIRDEIFEQFNIVRERIAQGIHDNDWSAVGWNVALIAAVIMAVVALAVGVLALVWKILGTLLGKIFFSCRWFWLSSASCMRSFFGSSRKARQTEHNGEALERWAGQVYYYVRDSMYYVFRTVARRTSIQMPDDPADIEMRNKFSVKVGTSSFSSMPR